MTKEQARRLVGSRKQQLEPLYIEQANQSIFQKLIQMEEYQQAETIFCYVSTAEEVNTWPVIGHALECGKKVGVPLCLGKGRMEVRELTSFQQLKKGMYGIMEPISGTRVMDKEEIQFGVIPCVSADLDHRRLGHGAGYYDRYLEDTDFFKVALCWKKVMMDQIPIDPHDVQMDQILFEDEL